MEFISKIHIFKKLPEDWQKRIAEAKKVLFLKKYQIIYHEGSPSTGIYCLEEGLCKQYKTSPDGKQYIVRLAKKYETLGLETILSDQEYDSSAEMLVDGKAWYVPKQILMEAIDRNHETSRQIMMILSNQLKTANEDRLELAHGTVRERVANLLLVLGKRHGVMNKDNHLTIDLHLTREELAEMAGTVTETTVRILSDFKAEKLIFTKGQEIRILNPEGIAKIAAHNFC